MSKKYLLSVAAAICFQAALYSQNPYVPTGAGTELKYRLEDRNGKFTGYRTITVKSAEEAPQGLMLTTVTVDFDTDGKPLDNQSSMEYKVRVTDKETVYLKEGMAPKFDLPDNKEIVVKGDDVVYSVGIEQGQQLPSAQMTVYKRKMQNGKTQESKLADISYDNRVAGAPETVTVPYGTFDTVVLSEELTIKALAGLVGRNRTMEKWFAPGIGQVMFKEYDKKGNLLTVAKLISVSHVSGR